MSRFSDEIRRSVGCSNLHSRIYTFTFIFILVYTILYWRQKRGVAFEWIVLVNRVSTYYIFVYLNILVYARAY